ncbi:hypothetical protein Aglo03_09430 [Actinokineospora globicatena]|uniref:Peptidase M48 domain-containing protein n=2 Tax=Actinokineospora globicatena TaxID=103729 RepID=A0A9W6QK96_9PSEU|nr:hypothetical protein Aglo03_09430 [Actinokineospora globicatena]
MVVACLATTVITTRLHWVRREPCGALALWVGAVLAVPLAAVGALVMLAADPHSSTAELLPVTAAAVLGAALALWASARVGRELWAINRVARRRRRRHEMLIDLFATEHAGQPGVAVIPDQRLFAYSVPCVFSGRIVMSQGAIDALDEHSLRAVIAHEQAHLRERHHLVAQLGTAMARSFPTTCAAVLSTRVSEFLELCADCSARRRAGAPATLMALTEFGDIPTPVTGMPAGGTALAVRLAALRGPSRCCNKLCSRAIQLGGAALPVIPALALTLNWMIDLCPWWW